MEEINDDIVASCLATVTDCVLRGEVVLGDKLSTGIGWFGAESFHLVGQVASPNDPADALAMMTLAAMHGRDHDCGQCEGLWWASRVTGEQINSRGDRAFDEQGGIIVQVYSKRSILGQLVYPCNPELVHNYTIHSVAEVEDEPNLQAVLVMMRGALHEASQIPAD